MPELGMRRVRDPNKGQVRVVFMAPPDFKPLTSLFVKPTQDGFDLVYDYPDFHPTTSWKVEFKGELYSIASVDGRKIELEGGV